MKVAVKVMPKDEVLDSQGRAVLQVLQQEADLNYKECHVGKYIVLDLDEADQSSVIKKLKSDKSNVLYNPLIEKIEVEVL